MNDDDLIVQAFERMIGRWHDGAGSGVSLIDFLGITRESYALYVEKNVIPDVYNGKPSLFALRMLEKGRIAANNEVKRHLAEGRAVYGRDKDGNPVWIKPKPSGNDF